MANCLPGGKDHLHLDSLQDQRVEIPNDDDFLSHGSERERISSIALGNEHFDHRLVQGQELESGIHNNLVFTDDELVELELLCIVTGDWYPVTQIPKSLSKPLSYEVKNNSLLRVVVDQLRVALRGIHEIDGRANTFERWVERESSKSGCFEFEMGALHIAAKANNHLKHYRKDPAYWRNQSRLQQTDYRLSLARRKYLRGLYGFDDLVPDDSDEDSGDGKQKQRYDPFNPDWSKKETDLTDEQKLSFPSVQHQSEIMSSMFGIDPKSIQGHDLANSIIGKAPEDVCAKIPEIFRILHIESVVRSDLAAKFFRRQARIRDDLEKLHFNILKGSVKREIRLGKRANEPQKLINHLVNPDLTFHCTRIDLVPSIIRQGFLKPDEKNVRCGSTYGQGDRSGNGS